MTAWGRASRFDDKLIKVEPPGPWPEPPAATRALQPHLTHRLNLNCKCGGFLTGLVSAEEAEAVEREFRARHQGEQCGATDEATAIAAFARRTASECTAAMHPEFAPLSESLSRSGSSLSRFIK